MVFKFSTVKKKNTNGLAACKIKRTVRHHASTVASMSNTLQDSECDLERMPVTEKSRFGYPKNYGELRSMLNIIEGSAVTIQRSVDIGTQKPSQRKQIDMIMNELKVVAFSQAPTVPLSQTDADKIFSVMYRLQIGRRVNSSVAEFRMDDQAQDKVSFHAA